MPSANPRPWNPTRAWCDYITLGRGKGTIHRYATCVMCTTRPESRAGRGTSDFLLYSPARELHDRAQLGAAPVFLEGEPVRPLLTGSPAAFPGAEAVPAAAVGAAARAPSWSAVVVGHRCWSGQGGPRPRVVGAARRSHAPLL